MGDNASEQSAQGVGWYPLSICIHIHIHIRPGAHSTPFLSIHSSACETIHPSTISSCVLPNTSSGRLLSVWALGLESRVLTRLSGTHLPRLPAVWGFVGLVGPWLGASSVQRSQPYECLCTSTSKKSVRITLARRAGGC
jgi:hypothetical protein